VNLLTGTAYFTGLNRSSLVWTILTAALFVTDNGIIEKGRLIAFIGLILPPLFRGLMVFII
jgi:hypothetical protein